MNNWYYILILLLLHLPLWAQNELKIEVEEQDVSAYSINPLSPAKAAFYSAVLPGLGQAYNKKYWKYINCLNVDGKSVSKYVPKNFKCSKKGSAQRYLKKN